MAKEWVGQNRAALYLLGFFAFNIVSFIGDYLRQQAVDMDMQILDASARLGRARFSADSEPASVMH